MSGAHAARIDDSIAHSGDVIAKSFGTGVGLGVGVGIGIIVAVVCAPALPIAILGGIAIANDGAQLGNWLGGLGWGKAILPEVTVGWIKTGVTSVKIGEAKKEGACIEDEVMCIGGGLMEAGGALLAFPLGTIVVAASQIAGAINGTGHTAAKLAEGVLKITYELRNAARVGCQTTCGAWVSKGETSVLLGGELGRLAGFPRTGDISETGGIDDALAFTDWIGAACTLAAALVAGSVLAIAAASLAILLKALGLGYGEDATGTAGIPDALDDLKHLHKVKGVIPKIVVAAAILAGAAGVPGLKITKRVLEDGPKGKEIPVIHPSR